MRTTTAAALLLLFAIPAGLPPVVASGSGDRPASTSPPPGGSRPPAPLPGVPDSSLFALHFEENRGQADPRARFVARPRGFRVLFEDDAATLILPGGGVGTSPCDALRIGFPRSRPGAVVAAREAMEGRSHYFLGNDPARWVRGARHFAALEVADLWPGVDLHWKGRPGNALEYAFTVAPGADPAAIALSFEGASTLSVDAAGDLLVTLAGGVLRHSRPVAWQEAEGRRVPVIAGFTHPHGGTVGIAVGAHDPALPLVIDPTLEFSVMWGGESYDRAYAVAVDPGGGFLVAGATDSSLFFPVVHPLQESHGGAGSGPDAFLARFAPDGRSLEWCTYFGGIWEDRAYGVAVDAEGAIFLTGETWSNDFPILDALKVAVTNQDAFLSKFTPEGDGLLFSTYLGGAKDEFARALALDGEGRPVLVGQTKSSDFPSVDSLQVPAAGMNAFVVRYLSDGSAIDFATTIGGSLDEEALGVAVGGDGAILVTGLTKSADFPLEEALQSSRAGTMDAFVLRLEENPPALAFSTYLGGAGEDEGRGIAADAGGSAWVAGRTKSTTGFPLASPLRSGFGGVSEAFLARISPAGALSFSTYVGGAGPDEISAITIAPWGGIYLAGGTFSGDFPVKEALQETVAGYWDAFVHVVDPRGPVMHSSTYFGGDKLDEAHGVAVDPDGRILAVGWTVSTDFPLTGYLQEEYFGEEEAFAFGFRTIPFAPGNCTAVLTGLDSAEISWTAGCPTATAFRLERRTGSDPFATVAVLEAEDRTFQHADIEPSTTWQYRVIALNDEGETPPSGIASITTPAPPTYPPAAPTGLAAEVVNPRRLDLSWSDNSEDETYFVLSRGTDGSQFALLATPSSGSTAYSDTTVLPGRTYHYTVHAVSAIGSSLKSNGASATLPSTVTWTTGKSRILDRSAPGKDKVSLSGDFSMGEGAGTAEFRPAEMDLSLRIGDWTDPSILHVAGGGEGWKEKKGKWKWKSPRGSAFKAKVIVEPAAGRLSVSLSRVTLPLAPANPVRVTLGLGTDGGTEEAEWIEGRKAGDFKHP